MKFKDLPAAQIGRYGEKVVSRLLRSLGAGVIATLKFSGENDNEAPSLEFDDHKTTLADFDVSMRGRTFSLEAKTYKEPQWNRTYRCMVHGIPVRLFAHYLQQEKERGIPVHLGILEVDSGAFIVSDDPVSKIAPRYACQCGCDADPQGCAYQQKWGNAYPQWYFRRDSFREWSRLEGDDLRKLQLEHDRVGHALRKHRDGESFTPYPQNGKPWIWACLACNASWTNSERHRCNPQPQLVAYWTRRLSYALPQGQLETTIKSPVMRSQLVGWFGENWDARGDFVE